MRPVCIKPSFTGVYITNKKNDILCIMSKSSFLTCATCGRCPASLSVGGRTAVQNLSAVVWSGSDTIPSICAVHQQDVASQCMPSHYSQDPCDLPGAAAPRVHTLQASSAAWGTHHPLAATYQQQWCWRCRFQNVKALFRVSIHHLKLMYDKLTNKPCCPCLHNSAILAHHSNFYHFVIMLLANSGNILHWT